MCVKDQIPQHCNVPQERTSYLLQASSLSWDRSILPAYTTGQGWTGEDKLGEKIKSRQTFIPYDKKPQYLQWDRRWHQAGERGNNIGKAVKQVILSHFCTTRWGGLSDISSKSDLFVICVERVCISLCSMNKYLRGDAGVCLHKLGLHYNMRKPFLHTC